MTVVREPVPQGRLKTPFFPRLSELDTVYEWHEWKGYSSPDSLYCGDMEYFAIRNSTGVFDLSPMTKYRITGPDALDYLNRLVTRDMAKVKPGRVAYAVWCDDQGSTTVQFFICMKASTGSVVRNVTSPGFRRRRSDSMSMSCTKQKTSRVWRYRVRRHLAS